MREQGPKARRSGRASSVTDRPPADTSPGSTTDESVTVLLDGNVLVALTAHARHRFWPYTLGYGAIDLRGLVGHRQITDAYLAALARHHRGRLATFDQGLVALHPDVAVRVG